MRFSSTRTASEAPGFNSIAGPVCRYPQGSLTTGPSPAIFVQMAWTARFGAKKAAVTFTGLRDAALKRNDLLVTMTEPCR